VSLVVDGPPKLSRQLAEADDLDQELPVLFLSIEVADDEDAVAPTAAAGISRPHLAAEDMPFIIEKHEAGMMSLVDRRPKVAEEPPFQEYLIDRHGLAPPSQWA